MSNWQKFLNDNNIIPSEKYKGFFNLNDISQILFYITGITLVKDIYEDEDGEPYNKLNDIQFDLLQEDIVNIFFKLSEYEITWINAFDEIINILKIYKADKRFLKGENLTENEDEYLIFLKKNWILLKLESIKQSGELDDRYIS